MQNTVLTRPKRRDNKRMPCLRGAYTLPARRGVHSGPQLVDTNIKATFGGMKSFCTKWEREKDATKTGGQPFPPVSPELCASPTWGPGSLLTCLHAVLCLSSLGVSDLHLLDWVLFKGRNHPRVLVVFPLIHSPPTSRPSVHYMMMTCTGLSVLVLVGGSQKEIGVCLSGKTWDLVEDSLGSSLGSAVYYLCVFGSTFRASVLESNGKRNICSAYHTRLEC